jgi:hypothetical protein
MSEGSREADRRKEAELASGPTHEIRAAEGHGDEGEEITKGPTPEVREAEKK